MTKQQSLLYLIRLLKSPYLIGFYRGHAHLTDVQVDRIGELFFSHDLELQARVVRNYEDRFANLVGNGYS